jgi:hypothetical protein
MREIPPVGDPGGTLRKDQAEGVTKTLAVLVSAGMLIDYIQLLAYCDSEPLALTGHGGDGGHFTPFVLARDEYLTGITGWYGAYINSLTLHTNHRSSRQFGGRGGEREFSIQAGPGEQIVGLICRAETFVHAIGAILAPAPR